MEHKKPPPPPREIKLWKCLWLHTSSGITSILFLALGAFILIFFSQIGGGIPPGPDMKLASKGIVVKNGRLIRKPFFASGVRINNKKPLVFVFEFKTKDGKVFKGKSFCLDYDLIPEVLKNNGQLPVQYLPEDPECARILGTRVNPFPEILFLIPLFFLLFGVIVFIWWFTKGLSLKSLLETGEAVKARIVNIEPVVYVNPHPFKITWQILDPLPLQKPEGSCWLPRRIDFIKKIKEGDIIWVICDYYKNKCFPWFF